MADAIAITLHQLPHSLGERAAKAFDIQRSVDVLCYAFLRCTRSPIQRRIVVPPRQAHCFLFVFASPRRARRGDDVPVLLVSMASIGSAGDFYRLQYRGC